MIQKSALNYRNYVIRRLVKLIKIKVEDIGNSRFQQDGTTCHTAEATLDVLRSVFKDYQQ